MVGTGVGAWVGVNKLACVGVWVRNAAAVPVSAGTDFLCDLLEKYHKAPTNNKKTTNTPTNNVILFISLLLHSILDFGSPAMLKNNFQLPGKSANYNTL